MIVIDTSVVLKWFVSEAHSDRAVALVGTQLVAPDLILAELGNALWKKSRKGEIGAEQARAALSALPDAIELLPSPPLADVALALALELGHPVYDCFFLALAEQLDVHLVTADVRMIIRLATTRYADRLQKLA